MRVAVRGQGYAGAVEALVSGNLLAADACTALADRLQGYGAMAGDDATAEEFAASYDEAATEALSAFADLVGAFGSLGHLAQASLANHHAAEVASGGYAVSAPPTRADDSVGMLVATPPTSLGGDAASVPGPVAWVLDQIEGFVWPDADTERLRAAAGSWRTAAGSVSLLAAHCDTTLADLADELSPEIPLAVATTQDLRARVVSLSDQLDAIGGACDAYADQVDAKRDEMLDLLVQLSVELGATAIIGGGLSLISAGLAAPAAGAVGSARVAWAARELKVIVDSLRLLTSGTATTLRPVSATLRDTRAYLSRLRAARITARTERGSIRLGWGPGRKPGWLAAHERSGSHTLEKHVGKTSSDLRSRLQREPQRPAASSFYTQRNAEKAIERTLQTQQDAVADWLASGRYKRPFVADLGYDVGRIMVRETDEILMSTKVRVVLVRDSTMPDGWRVLTAYPEL